MKESRIDNPESARFVADAEKKRRDLAAEARESNNPDNDLSKLLDEIADSDGRFAERVDTAARTLSMRDLGIQLQKYDGVDENRVRLIKSAIARKKELEQKDQ